MLHVEAVKAEQLGMVSNLKAYAQSSSTHQSYACRKGSHFCTLAPQSRLPVAKRHTSILSDT